MCLLIEAFLTNNATEIIQTVSVLYENMQYVYDEKIKADHRKTEDQRWMTVNIDNIETFCSKQSKNTNKNSPKAEYP